MPLLELKCTRCGFVNEELVKADGNYPPCPHCGGKMEQVYSGKLIVNCAKKEHCDGNCSHCGGCGK